MEDDIIPCMPRRTDPDLSHIAEPLHRLAVPIETLKMDPRNARRHPDRNLEAIRNSLRRFGQRKPIVVQAPDMVIRAGNGTVEAARAEGWSHIAAVVVEESDLDAAAFGIADNRTAELAEWDLSILLVSLNDIEISQPEIIQDLGFTPDDIAAMSCPDFSPSPHNEQPRLDQKSPVRCPSCGHEFIS